MDLLGITALYILFYFPILWICIYPVYWMNKKTKSQIDGVDIPISIDKDKYLVDEPGINELELLYFDKYQIASLLSQHPT